MNRLRPMPLASRAGPAPALATAALSVLALLVLTACASAPVPTRADPYLGSRVALECVPFARALSGIRLYGDAADWWWKAGGRYHRSSTPAVGSALVFERSGRLPSGHVAVVSRILTGRKIAVTHANWVPDRVVRDSLVIDVSAAGDWSRVRVWWPPSAQMGVRVYPAHGFVLPARPVSPDRLAAAAPRAVEAALGQ
jgi:hypothetical protein